MTMRMMIEISDDILHSHGFGNSTNTLEKLNIEHLRMPKLPFHFPALDGLSKIWTLVSSRSQMWKIDQLVELVELRNRANKTTKHKQDKSDPL